MKIKKEETSLFVPSKLNEFGNNLLVAKPRKKGGGGGQLKFFSIFIARPTRAFTTFESRKAISTVIVIERRDEGGGKILLIQLPPGSKVFSLVVLIKRERVTRDDSFFLFLPDRVSLLL